MIYGLLAVFAAIYIVPAAIVVLNAFRGPRDVGLDGVIGWPRSFSFDPTETFLYSCNQRADHIATFRVDRKSGALAFTGQYTPVGNPSIIVFLDLAKPA